MTKPLRPPRDLHRLTFKGKTYVLVPEVYAHGSDFDACTKCSFFSSSANECADVNDLLEARLGYHQRCGELRVILIRPDDYRDYVVAYVDAKVSQ